MNPQTLETVVQLTAKMGDHERTAVRKRLAQIAVAVGHPKLTSKQLAALFGERTKLERALAADLESISR
jgi:hypothetical protein